MTTPEDETASEAFKIAKTTRERLRGVSHESGIPADAIATRILDVYSEIATLRRAAKAVASEIHQDGYPRFTNKCPQCGLGTSNTSHESYCAYDNCRWRNPA